MPWYEGKSAEQIAEVGKVARTLDEDIWHAVGICYPGQYKSLEQVSWSHILNVLVLMGWRRSASDMGSSEY